MTVMEAIQEWPELSGRPPVTDFVDVEHLDNLFRAGNASANGRLPTVSFFFQGCQVEVLYGSAVRVTIQRGR